MSPSAFVYGFRAVVRLGSIGDGRNFPSRGAVLGIVAKEVYVLGQVVALVFHRFEKCECCLGIVNCAVTVFLIKLICESDFKAATLAAANAAEAGDSVLLTPACASFDAFENFERRGEFFRDIIKEL